MDKNLPYNEQEQFNDLPLPDAEQSWQGMKKLLDEDEDNRKPVVPLFLKTCAGWGFVLLLAGALAWYLLQPGAENKKPAAVVQTNPGAANDPASSIPGDGMQIPETITSPDGVGTAPGKNKDIIHNKRTSNTPESSTSVENDIALNPNKHPQVSAGIIVPSKTNSNTTNSKTNIVGNQKAAISKQPSKGVKKSNAAVAPVITKATPGNKQLTSLTIDSNHIITGSDKHPSSTDSGALSIDTVARVVPAVAAPDSANKLADTVTVVQQKKKAKRSLILSGGVGLQQQVPFGDQKAVPYDYYGRKSSVYDYIPSLYLRLEKEKKWFVQGEFRYGAPQSMKELAYSRQTRVDTTNIFLTTTSFRLKKTYYHQLPLSFNYYIMPNWSVGAGGIYSRFYGAVTEKEVRNLNVQTQAETVSRQIVNIKQFTDSFLYKTQVHLLLQTEYHWKRFTIGARYTVDAQPFIKYTRPDGSVDAKKNQTFQLMAKFRLFRATL